MRSWILRERWRIVLMGMLAGTVPIIALALFVQVRLSNALKDEIITEMHSHVDMAGHTISSAIERDMKIAELFGTRKTLQEAILKRNTKEIDDMLETLITRATHFDRAFVSDPNGIQLGAFPRTPELVGKSFAYRDWYKGLSKDWQPYVSKFYQRFAEPKRFLFAIAVPIKDTSRHVIGSITIQPTSSYLRDTLKNVAEKGSTIYVTDSDGMLIYHPSITADKIVDFSHVAPVGASIKDGDGTMTGVKGSTDRQIVIASYHKLRKWGWIVVLERPETDVFKPVLRVTKTLILVTALMLLISGWVSYRLGAMFDAAQRTSENLIEKERMEKIYSDVLVILNAPHENVGRLCDAYLSKLASSTSMMSGVLYVSEDGIIKAFASYCAELPRIVDVVALRAVKEGRTIRLDEIPPDHGLTVNAATGGAAPSDIVSVPLMFKDEAMGVFEAASHKGFTDIDMIVMEKTAPQLAIGISNVISRESERRVRQELERMNEELLATNDELDMQTKSLAEANSRLAEVSRAKSDFLANMSHELRTPLNSIIGFTEVLEDELYGGVNQKQKEYISHIHSSGSHLLNLITDILDLSKIESGKMELELASFRLKDAIESSLTMLKEKAGRHCVALSVDMAGGEDVQIEADVRKFKQILFNLLSNAVKFTNEGGSVKVSANKTNGSVLVKVTDTGIGIKPEDMPKLFKEFAQLESPYVKKHEGVGLGLALTKRLVELHGGIIDVQSTPGVGSVFSFTMPLRQPGGREAPQAQAPDAPTEKYGRGVQTIGKKALIIDDDQAAAMIVRDALLSEGFDVATAPNGEDGLKAAKKTKPDIIVLDLMMPGMDGFSVLDSLREMESKKPGGRGIPVIVITVLSLSQAEKQRLQSKADAVLEKGRFTRSEFIEETKRALAKSKEVRQK